MTRSDVLGAAGLVCAALATFAGMWIVVPAPTRVLAYLGLVAGELSLWLVIVGVAGIVLGLLAVFGGRSHSAVPWGAVLLGLSATMLALVPPVQAFPVAAAQDIQLSPWRALAGSFSGNRFEGTVSTITYGSPDGRAVEFDAYVPLFPTEEGSGSTGGAGVGPDRTTSGPRQSGRPAVIVLHGGSWNGGKKSEYPRWNYWLAAQGYVVFDVEYRLSPQPNWQSAIGDVKCALGVVRRDGAKWGIDPGRIALLGRSAGAQLALLVAFTPGNAQVRPSCDIEDGAVSAAISLYGPTDLIYGYTHGANPRVISGPGTLRAYLGGTPETAPAAFALASPIEHIGSGTPPALLMHGGRDQFVLPAQMQRLEQHLAEKGRPHETVFLPYAQHGFDYFFDGWSGQITQAAVRRFLRQTLRP
jgi:acetyl esterase/lipase